VLQKFIIATEQAVADRPAHLWIYDQRSDDFSGYKLALDRQPNDIVMYDARRQLHLDCESFTALTLLVRHQEELPASEKYRIGYLRKFS